MWGQALVPLLSPLFQQRRYRKGEIMAKQGAPATTLFYIQSGECEVLHRLDLEGDEDFEDEVSRCRGGACWQVSGVILLWALAAWEVWCQATRAGRDGALGAAAQPDRLMLWVAHEHLLNQACQRPQNKHAGVDRIVLRLITQGFFGIKAVSGGTCVTIMTERLGCRATATWRTWPRRPREASGAGRAHACCPPCWTPRSVLSSTWPPQSELPGQQAVRLRPVVGLLCLGKHVGSLDAHTRMSEASCRGPNTCQMVACS